MKTLEDVKKNFEYVLEFKDEYNNIFRIDYKAKKRLNEILGSNFLAVYRNEDRCGKLSSIKTQFDLDCETIYCVRSDGKVISFRNSEWGGIGLE